MSFGKEIYKLLLHHEIVIIPGLGAFVSEYRPAEINKDNDEIKPPSKSISFNPQLKNNDGLLVGYIAEKLHIAHFEALVRIEKERDDILYKLDAGYDVDIEGVGTLFYKEHGVICFRSCEEENMLLDSFGLDPMSISDPSVEATKEDTEEISEMAASTVIEPETKDKDQSEEDEKEQKLSTTEDWHKQNLTPENQLKEEKRKKKGWLILLVLIPLFVVAGFFFFNDFNGHSGNNNTGPEKTAEKMPLEQNIPLIDSAATDSITVEKQDTLLTADTSISLVEPMEDIVSEEQQDSIRYYLVGGSFSVKENADKYLIELQGKGYDAFHVGKKGRFFIIGISTYNTFNEVEEARVQYMKDNPDSEVWVYRK